MRNQQQQKQVYIEAEVYSKSNQIYSMEFFVKIIDRRKLLTISKKSSVLDVWHGFD